MIFEIKGKFKQANDCNIEFAWNDVNKSGDFDSLCKYALGFIDNKTIDVNVNQSDYICLRVIDKKTIYVRMPKKGSLMPRMCFVL